MDSDSNRAFDISEDDIYEAMKEMEGYLDITPGDFALPLGEKGCDDWFQATFGGPRATVEKEKLDIGSAIA